MADGESQFKPSKNTRRMLSEGLVENGLQSIHQEESSRSLQQHRQVFQARGSGQAMSSMVDRVEEDEELEPGRTSMVDMRPRGRKKPFNKAEGPVRGCSGDLNLQLPIQSSCNSQSSLVFDENQMVSISATELALEPRMALPSSRAREIKVMPEQWANVKMAQNSWCSGSSGAVPPNRPSFQPSREVDFNTRVAPWKIKLDVNTVLSAHLPAASEEFGQGDLQNQDEMPRTNEQSMYLKHLLLEGSMELSFEEVRANKYFAQRLQELEEKMQKRSQAKEIVLQQIEEKMRLLRQRQQQLEAVTGAESMEMTGDETDFTMPASQQNAMAFQIFDEESQQRSVLTSGRAMPSRSDSIPDDVFLPPGERGLCLKTPQPFQSGKIPHSEQTLSKNVPEKRESLSVDVVNGHQNNTLCASPEDTLDFAKAAKIASTPSSCASGKKAVSPDPGTLTEASGMTTETISQPTTKLSPIQEASVDMSCSLASGLASTSSQGSSSGGQANPHLSRHKRNLPASSPEASDQNSLYMLSTVLEDPCGQSLRQRLLDQVDLRSFPNFHSEEGDLPTVKEDDLLVLGKETFATYSKMDFKNFSIFEGLGDGYIAIKVERCAVPWDFYIRSRLRERLARDSQAPVHDAGRCYRFRDGCITIHKACHQRTLSEMAEDSFEEVVMSMAIQTVELVRRMHSCSLIHGALHPDTLVMNRPRDERDQAVVALDFSCSLDLEMQPEVTAARSLTSAQGFITQGLLSPTASPYQVDLLGIAETMHTLLKRVRWPVNDKSEWTLQNYQEAEFSDQSCTFWSKFFRTLLSPGDRSSVSVLTELLEDMKKSDFAF